jgi:hypothetical protein
MQVNFAAKFIPGWFVPENSSASIHFCLLLKVILNKEKSLLISGKPFSL